MSLFDPFGNPKYQKFFAALGFTILFSAQVANLAETQRYERKVEEQHIHVENIQKIAVQDFMDTTRKIFLHLHEVDHLEIIELGKKLLAKDSFVNAFIDSSQKANSQKVRNHKNKM